MFRADTGIVQPGGNRVGVDDLAVIILQQIGAVAVQDAGAAALEAGGVLVGVQAQPGGLDADQADILVIDEGVEQACGPATVPMT